MKYQLIAIVREMAKRKKEYEAISAALEAVRQTGYGVVVPAKRGNPDGEPAVIRQGNRYGGQGARHLSPPSI